LYRRGDFKKALRVLESKRGSYNDRLLPFILAEYDWPAEHDWPARARKAAEDYAARAQDGPARRFVGHTLMNSQTVLYLLGKKEDAVLASKALQKRPELFDTLRRDPILRCLNYNAGDLTADELVQAANGSRWDQCLAHYSIGMTKLAEGDRKGAYEHFDRVVKTRAFIWGPYDLSWVFRARLEKDSAWPPWIPASRAK
jgi:hypothetical protein